jgi:hypothetical protein
MDLKVRKIGAIFIVMDKRLRKTQLFSKQFFTGMAFAFKNALEAERRGES